MRRLMGILITFSLLICFCIAPSLSAASAEQATTEWGIHNTFITIMGSEAAQNTDQVLQRDLYTGTVNGMAFTVSEAGYDGRSLFLRYSYLIPDAKNAFGVKAEEIYGEYLPEGMKPGSYVEGLTEEGSEVQATRQIGWWYDQFWIDGKGVNLLVGSMQSISGSDITGEIIETDYLPLYKDGISLDGTVRISLPIGTAPDMAEYDPTTHPEKFDAEGFLKLPEENVVSFELDTKDIRNQVRTFHPEKETELDGFTAKVREAAFTPLMTYVTVEMALKPGALEAFIAKNGEGITNGDGELILRYGQVDVVTPWIESLKLVDGQGTVLFPESGGLEEYGGEKAEFLYPYIGNLPEALFLAPYDEETGKADMSAAITVYTAD